MVIFILFINYLILIIISYLSRLKICFKNTKKTLTAKRFRLKEITLNVINNRNEPSKLDIHALMHLKKKKKNKIILHNDII